MREWGHIWEPPHSLQCCFLRSCTQYPFLGWVAGAASSPLFNITTSIDNEEGEEEEDGLAPDFFFGATFAARFFESEIADTAFVADFEDFEGFIFAGISSKLKFNRQGENYSH